MPLSVYVHAAALEKIKKLDGGGHVPTANKALLSVLWQFCLSQRPGTSLITVDFFFFGPAESPVFPFS